MKAIILNKKPAHGAKNGKEYVTGKPGEFEVGADVVVLRPIFDATGLTVREQVAAARAAEAAGNVETAIVAHVEGLGEVYRDFEGEERQRAYFVRGK